MKDIRVGPRGSWPVGPAGLRDRNGEGRQSEGIERLATDVASAGHG